MGPTPDYDAFISYARSDSDEIAALVQRLTVAHGLRIWRDQERLVPGDTIPEGISRGIARSRTFVVIVSSSALASGWVTKEYNSALVSMVDCGLPERVIPVILGDAGLPPPLRDRVAVRAANLRADETVQQIARGIKASSNPEVFARTRTAELATIIDSARDRLIIVGHTLKRFLSDLGTRQSLERALARGVGTTLMLQNPNSRFVDAYDYERILEESAEPSHEIVTSLNVLRGWLTALGGVLPIDRLRVVLTNHIPSHRAIFVDDRACYLGLYLFGRDVSRNPTLQLDSSGAEYEQEWYRNIRGSIHDQMDAPDSIDLIRNGAFDDRWVQRQVADFDRWPFEKKRRYILTWHFYRKEAREFRARFGKQLETYVRSYLKKLRNCRRVLVVGCGSGKEIEYLTSLGCIEVVGWDLSSVAIELAREELGRTKNQSQLVVGNFYDLDLEVGEPYDGIVANAALVHLLEHGDLKAILGTFFRRLNPGGLCFVRLLYKEGVQQEREDGRFGSSRWFTYFDGPTLRRTAEEVGFTVDTHADGDACTDGESELVAVRGFKHVEFERVYWPTALLRKPADGGA
jgi:SAM-dependent methyltransferase